MRLHRRVQLSALVAAAAVEGRAPNPSATLDDSCFEPYPNLKNCVTDVVQANGSRVVETNSVPPYAFEPYCPFGAGKGYCFDPPGSFDCDWGAMVCPAQKFARDRNISGDVMMPWYEKFVFPARPDPTVASAPRHIYDDVALVAWADYDLEDDATPPQKSGPDARYQVIGVHVNGVQLKGPAEAEGYNVDLTGLGLEKTCGAHITPPYSLPGAAMYHYHKAASCCHIESPGRHSPLIGYANDGFGVYGYADVRGDASVLDECRGHFGPLDDDAPGDVAYHYHAQDVNNTVASGDGFMPYYLGCQGPAKGLCESQVNWTAHDMGHVYCGDGCGADVCVQPGTRPDALDAYLDAFNATWLAAFTVNDFGWVDR